MEINFLTWNTGLYRYGIKDGKPIDDEAKAVKNGIFDFVEEHLKKPNAIAVLQEIPYKSNINWEEHEFFKAFKEKFTDYDYI